MSVSSIFLGALAGLLFLLILRIVHFLGVPRGRPRPDSETYEAGYYPLQPGVRRLRMQYTRRLMLFLAADGFLAIAVFLPYLAKEVALNVLIGLGLILAAAYKAR